ncbi:hypothetical protein COCVIDRAFT_38630 [Bipolaris victoriae FI3]|uniref:Peptidase S8/S53 domain-containing protein n=1 Tax=Bipolaris victoriae (strain FI3) TaxID=930091 RepID=W7EPD3_BIPV3|nr:hypothetical protein COCVIDRAFT_38630 [Bipolaris victoriae FI3]
MRYTLLSALSALVAASPTFTATGNDVAPLISSGSAVVFLEICIVVLQKEHTYEMFGFMGYSGHFSEETFKSIQRHSDINYVKRNSKVYLDKSDPEINDDPCDEHMIQRNVSWGLVRISQRNALESETWNNHLYAADGGEGVDIYIIDTGTNIEHVDFEGRATRLKRILENEPEEDSGKKGFKGSVFNMSLGGPGPAIDVAVRAGLHFAVSAGNENVDACTRHPARFDNFITVGASNLQDQRAESSNHGKCVDIFAPGDLILSTWIGHKYATNLRSRTSMASPHIAGLLAYMLSLQPAKNSAYSGVDITPQKPKANLLAVDTVDALAPLPSETKNVLLWNGGSEKKTICVY